MTMGGIRLRCFGPLSGHKESICDCEEITLDDTCVLYAIACGFLPQEPPVTSQEISDQSKTSLFAKIIAIWQILYFIADLVTRLVRRLPVSQLEVGVAAFGMLAIVTLCAYFDKPKGVNIGTRVSFQPSSKPEAQELKGEGGHVDIIRESPRHCRHQTYLEKLGDALFKRRTSFGLRSRSFYQEVTSQIFLDDDIDDMEGNFLMSAAAAGIFALPFGAVHVAAWNASFPSLADLWLWRISSLVSMVILLIGLGIAVLAFYLLKEADELTDHVVLTTFYFSVALYTLARVILIVEMVRCMLFLPPEAFVTTWTANVPHLG